MYFFYNLYTVSIPGQNVGTRSLQEYNSIVQKNSNDTTKDVELILFVFEPSVDGMSGSINGDLNMNENDYRRGNIYDPVNDTPLPLIEPIKNKRIIYEDKIKIIYYIEYNKQNGRRIKN